MNTIEDLGLAYYEAQKKFEKAIWNQVDANREYSFYKDLMIDIANKIESQKIIDQKEKKKQQEREELVRKLNEARESCKEWLEANEALENFDLEARQGKE